MKHNHNIELHQDKRILTVMVMNLIIPLTQIYGGFISGSMALISDAIHNLSDLTSILISMLFYDFDITLSTLQFETNPYHPAELLCPQQNQNVKK